MSTNLVVILSVVFSLSVSVGLTLLRIHLNKKDRERFAHDPLVTSESNLEVDLRTRPPHRPARIGPARGSRGNAAFGWSVTVEGVSLPGIDWLEIQHRDWMDRSNATNRPSALGFHADSDGHFRIAGAPLDGLRQLFAHRPVRELIVAQVNERTPFKILNGVLTASVNQRGVTRSPDEARLVLANTLRWVEVLEAAAREAQTPELPPLRITGPLRNAGRG